MKIEILAEIKFLDKNKKFAQNWIVGWKSKFFGENRNFGWKSNFLDENKNFAQNWIVGWKSKLLAKNGFLIKMDFFAQYRNFRENTKF